MKGKGDKIWFGVDKPPNDSKVNMKSKKKAPKRGLLSTFLRFLIYDFPYFSPEAKVKKNSPIHFASLFIRLLDKIIPKMKFNILGANYEN